MSKLRNCMITGIAGSGGSYLAEYVCFNHPDWQVHGLKRWHSTTNTDNLKSIKDKIKLHECDLLDLSSIIRVLREVMPERIFALASHANVRVCFDTPLAVLYNNVISMANLLEAVRLTCPEVLIQLCSTSEVYGNPKIFPMTEEHPKVPVNPYAVSKLTQETLAYAYHKSWNLRIIITRMFAYINPRRRDLFSSSFAYAITEIEQGHRVTLYHGNLDSIRTLIDVRDAMESYWIACDKCEIGETYNIGGETNMSVGGFLDKLIGYSKVSIIKEQNPLLLRPIDVTCQIPDCSKFFNKTGWKPKISIDESIQWLLEEVRRESK